MHYTNTLLSYIDLYVGVVWNVPSGVHSVNFTLIALGLSSATVSIAYGKVVKCFPQFVVVLLGAAIDVILLVFLFVWDRVPSYEVIFAFAIGWGVADAVWHNVSCSRLLYTHKNKNALLLVASFQT